MTLRGARSFSSMVVRLRFFAFQAWYTFKRRWNSWRQAYKQLQRFFSTNLPKIQKFLSSYLQQLNITGRVDSITQLRVFPLGQVVLLLAQGLLLGPHIFRSATGIVISIRANFYTSKVIYQRKQTK